MHPLKHAIIFRALLRATSSKTPLTRMGQVGVIPVRGSEHVPEAQLYKSSAVYCVRDLAEGRTSTKSVGVCEIGPVEEVVELASELHVLPLCYVEILQ